MNPIPTANAMKPAPGKGVSSFPTPVIKDTVIVEVVNAWKGDYQPLEYGTKWDDVPHASVQGSFPDHKLVNQSPNSEDGQWVKRIWANDRVDQDTYNYAIKYSGGSDAHPIYIRTYILPREGYAPVPDLSPDPLFPSALLVDEEVQRQEDELDSRYVKVIRTYETLPGPQITSQRYTERGDIETISSQQVSPNTAPDPDGLLVTQSQVIKEDVSKGTKTTATVSSYTQLLVKEKKEGLLGETITTDDIVSPSTNPDELSQSVISSVVQQTSATKAVKRTTTASGPTSLTTKSKDGKLLGDVTVTETIVAPDANPDTPSGVQSGILSSEVKQTDSGKGIKRNSVLNSTPTLLGSETKGGLLGATTTEETIVPSGTSAGGLTLSIVSSTVEPIDATRSRRVVVTAGGPTTLSGKQKKEGLLGETTVTESIVVADSEADALSQTIVSSVVEPIDSAKSKKTTIESSGPTSLTKKQKKEGLLGDVTITESIVAPNAQPDPLSFTVISSEVSQIDSGKSQKTTTESSGPLALNVESLTDSPLGLVTATVQRSIVAQAQLPENGTTVLRDSIQAIDEFKSQRERITVGSWPINHGQDFDPQFATGFLYEETIVPLEDVQTDTGLQNFSEYKIIDNTKALRRRYNKEQIRGILNSQYYKIVTAVNIKLPDVLKSVVVYWGRSAGVGEDTGAGIGTGSGTYSASADSSSQSSGGISGDVYFEISNGFDGQINGFSHEFFLEIGPDGTITNQDILSSLQGGPYLNWPVIRTQTDNIVLISGTKSKTEKNSKSVSVNVNGAIINESGGKSYSVDVNANSINVPNCLRGIIEITENFIGDDFGAQSDITPTYGFFPEILPATTPVSFPTGKYLYSSNVELYKWGFVKVNAVTVEITAAHVS